MAYSDFLGYAYLDPIVDLGKVTVVGLHTAVDTVISIDATDYTNVLRDIKNPDDFGDYTLLWFDDTNFTSPISDPNAEFVRITAHNDGLSQITVTRGQHETLATTKNTAGATYEMILCLHSRHFADIGNNLRLTPVRFGAVGDGSFNNTTAFQNAIDELELSPSGGTLYIPDGNFHIAGTLTIVGDGINIIGNGDSSQITKTGTGNLIDLGDSAGGRSMFGMSRLRIVGGSTPNRALNVLTFRTVRITDCRFDWEGQSAIGGTNLLIGRIQGCDFSSIATFGIDLTDGHTINISSCSFNPEVVAAGTAIRLIGPDTASIVDTSFSNMVEAISLNDATNVVIAANIFASCTTALSDVTAQCTDVEIIDNRFNVTSGVFANSIDLTDVRNFLLRGNLWFGNYTQGAPIRISATTVIDSTFGPNGHTDANQVSSAVTVPASNYFWERSGVKAGALRMFTNASVPAVATGEIQMYHAVGEGTTLVRDVAGTDRAIHVRVGVVDPNGTIIGSVGDLFLNTALSRFWIKFSGNNTTTTWVRVNTV